MARNPRYDILFEPVPIGPVVARNRFYQVPHCTGMGGDLPHSVARMREIKAEGGWAVVNTEYSSMHWSSDDGPYKFCSLWDERDVKIQALTADAIHRHGALAGTQLWHGGGHAPNRITRETAISPSGGPQHAIFPQQTRAMDRADIRNLRRWQVAAARRAMRAGFDIVYVFAAHDYLPLQFASRRWNRRGDEYGGAIENRVRLIREMVEETRHAIGHRCAVALRLAIDELMGAQGIACENEGRDMVALMAELPDLWDVNISDVQNDSMSARFGAEGFQEKYIDFVKKLTTKPVVGVGRFTSPDTMVSQVKRGILDLIGAARPSIADPFLPRKIDEGREDEIRECIGCNICRASNNMGAVIRCTQNPTMGEEYRRGWHPEKVAPAGKFSDDAVLVVGAGPAGLECAMTLGKRGYKVALAESRRELGGRATLESNLPGLATQARVRDWRQGQIAKLANVEIFRESKLGAAEVLEFGYPHVVIATGATWRRDGIGHHVQAPIPGMDLPNVLTPDDIMGGIEVQDPVLIYDDDHYYMGGVLAEKLLAQGRRVILATPGSEVSSWTFFTDEQFRVQANLLERGAELLLSHVLSEWKDGVAEFACRYTGRTRRIEAASLVTVTSREPDDALYRDLAADPAALSSSGIKTCARIGDCEAPGAIVHAVYSGHRFAREFGEEIDRDLFPYRRELVFVK